jgi:hypothetical protein
MYGIFHASFRLDHHDPVLALSVITSLVVTRCHLSVETDEAFFFVHFLPGALFLLFISLLPHE